MKALSVTCVFWNVFRLFSHGLIHALLTTPLIHHILLSCQSSRENAHMPFLSVLFQGQAWVYVVSVPSCSQAGTSGPLGLEPEHLGTGCGLLAPLLPSLPSLPLPCHLIFRHKSLPIEPTEGSWQMLRRRNHNSCRSVTYANMFTHEGILSKENLPHANSLHVCHVAPVSRRFKHEITG